MNVWLSFASQPNHPPVTDHSGPNTANPLIAKWALFIGQAVRTQFKHCISRHSVCLFIALYQWVNSSTKALPIRLNTRIDPRVRAARHLKRLSDSPLILAVFTISDGAMRAKTQINPVQTQWSGLEFKHSVSIYCVKHTCCKHCVCHFCQTY